MMQGVLLVDDDKNFRRSLAVNLEMLGYQVYEAKNGMEALQFLKDNQENDDKVSGVIVDARMPGLDGFWLTDQLLASYPELRVIILSAYPCPSKSDRYTFLTKPVKIEKLTQVLNQ
ncbi:MAG: response regulator [bacterium]